MASHVRKQYHTHIPVSERLFSQHHMTRTMGILLVITIEVVVYEWRLCVRYIEQCENMH